MFKGYVIQLLKELATQLVRYVPREKKLEQLNNAEEFYYAIDPEKEYTYGEICFQITEYHPEMNASTIYPGHDVQNDVLCLIEDLADSAVISEEQVSEALWTIEQLSERFHVSTKTIARWRKVGLVSRRVLVDGKKRVVFLDHSVEQFVQRNPDRIRRGETFSQLSEEERKAIIMRAKKLSETGGNPTEVAKRLSESTGRSVETIRYTLKAFDEAHVDDALFPNRNTPLPEETKWKIYQGFRKGESIDDLAKRYRRTKGSIYRIIGAYRVKRIMELPLDYIDNPGFASAESDKKDIVFLGQLPKNEKTRCKPRQENAVLLKEWKRLPGNNLDEPFAKSFGNGEFDCEINSEVYNNDDEIVSSDVFQETAMSVNFVETSELPPYLAGLYEIPLLTPEQEVHLFRKMNYLKYKASRLRSKLNVDKPKVHLMSQIEEYYDLAVATKNEIVAANLRLVVSIAKKHVSPFVGFFELVSDGNLSLMKAVEKFDYARGNKFSTYATWAVMRNFARTIPDEKKLLDRFRPSEMEAFELAEDFRSSHIKEEKLQKERENLVDQLMDELSDREQQILSSRYGLGKNELPRTLRQIGADMDVTKERVRQIEIRALAKLRKVVEEECLEIP